MRHCLSLVRLWIYTEAQVQLTTITYYMVVHQDRKCEITTLSFITSVNRWPWWSDIYMVYSPPRLDTGSMKFHHWVSSPQSTDDLDEEINRWSWWFVHAATGTAFGYIYALLAITRKEGEGKCSSSENECRQISLKLCTQTGLYSRFVSIFINGLKMAIHTQAQSVTSPLHAPTVYEFMVGTSLILFVAF